MVCQARLLFFAGSRSSRNNTLEDASKLCRAQGTTLPRRVSGSGEETATCLQMFLGRLASSYKADLAVWANSSAGSYWLLSKGISHRADYFQRPVVGRDPLFALVVCATGTELDFLLLRLLAIGRMPIVMFTLIQLLFHIYLQIARNGSRSWRLTLDNTHYIKIMHDTLGTC